MINHTDIPNQDLLERNPFGVILADAIIVGCVDPYNPNRTMGYTDLLAYFPDSGRAAHVTNADPVWFDAGSLEEARRIAFNDCCEEA